MAELDLGPCCPQSKSGLMHITVKGVQIGIQGLGAILKEVRGMGLAEDEQIAALLLEKVKKSSYVPSSAEPDYKTALLEVYKRTG